MAFLLPENIASRSDVPTRLRDVAKAFRDFTPEEVTVWLRVTQGGLPYLVVLDPAAGIMVIDAPPLSKRSRRRRLGRVFESLDMAHVPEEIAQQLEIAQQKNCLSHGIDALQIEGLPTVHVLAVPDGPEIPARGVIDADLELPVLTGSDLTGAGLVPAIRRIFGGERHRPLSDQEEKRARAVVNPSIILPQPRAASLPLFQDPDTGPEDVIRVMDRRQERVAEHLGFGYRVLRGVAGSGKTLVLAHRARYLHQHWPDWRILMLCFNRVLANALGTMVKADDRLEVTNIDRLAYRLAGGTSRGGAPDFDALVVEAERQARERPDSERFDVVLVDEAQDFDHPRLNLAYSMLKSDRLEPDPAQPDRDNFVMAYDVAQDVYRRGGARWSPPGVDAQGRPRTARGRSTVFRRNYRNTQRILEFAMNFLAGSQEWTAASVDLDDPAALIPPEAASRAGLRPLLTTCRDPRGEAETIAGRVAKMRDGGAAAGDIVVMYGHSELEKELRRSFSRQGLPYFHVQERDGGGRMTNRDKAVQVRGKVRVSTLTGIKGLEFSRVLIGGVNQIRVPDVAEEDQSRAAKSHLYAAMTRAMDQLEITVSGRGAIGAALREAERLQRVG